MNALRRTRNPNVVDLVLSVGKNDRTALMRGQCLAHRRPAAVIPLLVHRLFNADEQVIRQNGNKQVTFCPGLLLMVNRTNA